LFKALGAIKEGPQIDKWTHEAYKQDEEKRWRANSYFSSSFHASSYPGADKSCGRKALYKLMNFPEPEPISPKGIGIMGVGKAVEEQIVERWAKMGILLGPQPPEQLRIEFEDLWLSGYGDAVLNLSPEYFHVLPVEIKTKANKVIEYMKVGGQAYDEAHYYQLQAYILWCIQNYREMGWNKIGLNPPEGGVIYYVSREDPRNTHEFYIEFDRKMAMEAGMRLKKWRKNFLYDELPERPKDWKWTEEPCKWCPFKKHVCKPDHVAGIVKLSESAGVEFAQAHTPSYNIENVRRRVKERWTYKQLELF